MPQDIFLWVVAKRSVSARRARARLRGGGKFRLVFPGLVGFAQSFIHGNQVLARVFQPRSLRIGLLYQHRVSGKQMRLRLRITALRCEIMPQLNLGDGGRRVPRRKLFGEASERFPKFLFGAGVFSLFEVNLAEIEECNPDQIMPIAISGTIDLSHPREIGFGIAVMLAAKLEYAQSV